MKLRLIGLALVAAFALTAASSASAVEWHASKAGTIKITGSGLQTLTLANGVGITCEVLTGSTHITNLVTLSQTLLVNYSKCEAFGSKAVTVTTGTILFDANGSVGVFTDKIVVGIAVAKCSVLVTVGGANTLLGTIKYTNLSNGKVEGKAEVQGIQYEVNNGGVSHTQCGTDKEVNVAKYEGKGTTELEGGTIKVE